MTLHRAATLQLVSGVMNTWFMAAIMWGVLGAICGGATQSIGMVGGLWGWAACLLAPFGAVEIVMSLQSRASPETSEVRIRRLAYAQVASLAIGGLTPCIVGLLVLRKLEPS